MQTVSMLIGGQRRHSSSGATFVRRNPLDGEVASAAPAGAAAPAPPGAAAAPRALS
ncbi:salicylaldehyde dehydrogenase, partial [Burkholderia ambifaria]